MSAKLNNKVRYVSYLPQKTSKFATNGLVA